MFAQKCKRQLTQNTINISHSNKRITRVKTRSAKFFSIRNNKDLQSRHEFIVTNVLVQRSAHILSSKIMGEPSTGYQKAGI